MIDEYPPEAFQHLWRLGVGHRSSEAEMAGKTKRIEAEDLAFFRTYLGGRILNETFADLLALPAQREPVQAAVEQALQRADLVALNAWLEQDVTPEARKVIWGASRSRAHRRRNPRSEHTLCKKTAQAALRWANTEDIDEAVRLLLQAVGAETGNHG